MGEDPRHGLLVALVVGLVGVLLLIFAALAVAPVLVIVLGLMTYVVWWYVSREDTSYMHHAQVRCCCPSCRFLTWDVTESQYAAGA